MCVYKSLLQHLTLIHPAISMVVRVDPGQWRRVMVLDHRCFQGAVSSTNLLVEDWWCRTSSLAARNWGRALRDLPWLSSFSMVLKPEFWWTWGHFWGQLSRQLRRSLPIELPKQCPKPWLRAVYKGLNYPDLSGYMGIIVGHCYEFLWMVCHKGFQGCSTRPFPVTLVSYRWLFQATRCLSHCFEGLSELFVALPLPKLLVVGAVDRMDATLEAAHMQGRFRLVSWAISLGELGRSWKKIGGVQKQRGGCRRDIVLCCLFGEGVGSLGEILVRTILRGWNLMKYACTYASRWFMIVYVFTVHMGHTYIHMHFVRFIYEWHVHYAHSQVTTSPDRTECSQRSWQFAQISESQ